MVEETLCVACRGLFREPPSCACAPGYVDVFLDGVVETYDCVPCSASSGCTQLRFVGSELYFSADDELTVALDFNLPLLQSVTAELLASLLAVNVSAPPEQYALALRGVSGARLALGVAFSASQQSVRVQVAIPPNSTIRSAQLLTLALPPSAGTVVVDETVGPMLVTGASDRGLAQSFQSFADSVQDANSGAMQTLQQLYVLKYLLNSQIIAALMLVDVRVPASLFQAQRAFSSHIFLFTPAPGGLAS